MADSNIGALPLAPDVADDSLLVMEQQGAAMKLTGGMLKNYAKQGVELEFQEYLDQAQQAADSAAGAASAVVDMTVDAHTLEDGQSAAVTKTMKDGKVNLSFGLPRGERGIPGPDGPPGPAGPKGDPGAGLDIVGRYDTTGDVPDPQEGKSYYIGTEPPYDVYTYLDGQWVNNGPLSGGGGGGPLPENVVTAEGGAALEFGTGLGETPRTIRFTDEDDPPLTAAEVTYDGTETGMTAGNVQGALDELFTSVSDGKALIASAVTDKGVPTQPDAAFSEIAGNIAQISTGGGDTSDATATPGDILAGRTAYTASGKVEGIIPSLAAQTIVPGPQDKTIANGQYLAGTQTVKGDPNLTPANIRKGVTLFEVDGAMESSFKATLTVTADIGAVVTATCGDTEVEALSTTGTVVLELPIEGTWKVTAVRGAAQYNTVTLEVSSSYSAALTAEVHIEYFGTAEKLGYRRYALAATALFNRVIFAGGNNTFGGLSYLSARVERYDEYLSHSRLTDLSEAREYLGAASTDKHAIFAGGRNDLNRFTVSSSADAYDMDMTLRLVTNLGTRRMRLAATSIEGNALFGGGHGDSGSAVSNVDAYDGTLARTALTPLALAASNLAAASNEKHAIFGGGALPVTAYDKSLTRIIPASLSTVKINPAAARAGNYVLIAGGTVDSNPSDIVDAYDLFLTRISAEPLRVARSSLAGTTLRDYAVFGGGAGSGGHEDAVDVYDAYLTRTVSGPMSDGRSDLAAASVGDFVLFGGGYMGFSTETVDVYHYT